MMFLNFFSDNITTFEIIEKISTIIIAAFTLFFSWYIFKYQSAKNDNDLKLDWYKLIVVESKFDIFFVFFKKLNSALLKLKDDNLTIQVREEVNNQILDELNKLDLDFISLLLAVDKMLYECVKNQFDKLIDGLTEKLSNETLNLNEEEVFNDEISSHIADYKTQILKMFVDFRGKNDTHNSLIESFKEKYIN
ncbi:hypothetical protein C7447_103151 [Tenacibaculum adriaticum]|uniref:Uncharacterized protein n=1 Tax=Tenacibaculum adriaticum TaxID=413713 RepID=A0A5S5DQM8_9FLAO|nr:hypothetical protein [Tenacibaculum adriaticum]TYP97984.1 hypothetical protein C7447_103151 [Tenacibaculum adriaticum]